MDLTSKTLRTVKQWAEMLVVYLILIHTSQITNNGQPKRDEVNEIYLVHTHWIWTAKHSKRSNSRMIYLWSTSSKFIDPEEQTRNSQRDELHAVYLAHTHWPEQQNTGGGQTMVRDACDLLHPYTHRPWRAKQTVKKVPEVHEVQLIHTH